jgi:hypothetical protein
VFVAGQQEEKKYLENSSLPWEESGMCLNMGAAV